MKKEERMKKFMVYFIALIMIMSVFGVVFYGFNDPSAKKKYKGYPFTRLENTWQTKINGEKADFYYYPENLEDIELGDAEKDLLQEKLQFYMTSDLGDELNQSIALVDYEMNRKLPLAEIYTMSGFTGNNTYKGVITCSDASASIPVIYLKQGNESVIRAEGNCLIVEAERELDMIALSERIEYFLLGIMTE